jgi:hypothetical protein
MRIDSLQRFWCDRPQTHGSIDEPLAPGVRRETAPGARAAPFYGISGGPA